MQQMKHLDLSNRPLLESRLADSEIKDNTCYKIGPVLKTGNDTFNKVMNIVCSDAKIRKDIVAQINKSATQAIASSDQMAQKARGYASKASKVKGLEAVAYRDLAAKLRDKREVRAMLSFLKGARVILVNTFQYIGKGKIRVALLEPERK